MGLEELGATVISLLAGAIRPGLRSLRSETVIGKGTEKKNYLRSGSL
jgi:hypothetical protein